MGISRLEVCKSEGRRVVAGGYRDDVFRDGEWRHMSETWFIHAVNVYAFMLLTCGIVGLVGGGSCKGFCLDLHAFLAISLVALEGVLVGMYVVDRNAFDGIAQKD